MDKSASKQGLVIVRLLGGLGNQMFQYAFGRSMSIFLNRELKFDLDFYNHQKSKWALRTFSLDVFNLQIAITDQEDVKNFQKYLKPNIFSMLCRRASAYIPNSLKTYIFEPYGKNFIFNKSLFQLNLRSKVYFDGFWQTEKYFKQFEEIIRQDFSFKNPPDDINQSVLNEIAVNNSVAIHIRHGDNATKIAGHHGVLPIKYYQQAVLEVEKKVKNPHFYVFSDDPEWAKENLSLNYPVTFVIHNGEVKHHEDLRLMIACKHHIIGNSTFSWWGAWLGKKTGQLVYAPSRYHMKTEIFMGDYYPNFWNIIKL